jgi:hypothetical protein
MNLSEEIAKLQKMHETGTLTDEEFSRAKKSVLDSAEVAENRLQTETQQTLRQVQIRTAHLENDRAWEEERKRFLYRYRNGVTYLPTRASANNKVAVGVLFFLFTIGTVIRFPGPELGWLVVVGLAALGFMIVFANSERERVRRYEQAESDYLNRKRAISAGEFIGRQ